MLSEFKDVSTFGEKGIYSIYSQYISPLSGAAFFGNIQDKQRETALRPADRET